MIENYTIVYARFCKRPKFEKEAHYESSYY